MSHPEQTAEQVRAPKATTSGGRTAARAWLLGFLAGALGLAPWLIGGAKLPLQNLWRSEALPEHMPLALLPLSQYELTTIVALVTVGGAAAGLAVRIWSPEYRRLATWCAVGGVLVVQILAAAQSFTVLNQGLESGKMASLYFFGLLAGVILSLAASIGAVLLFASTSRVATTLGAGLMAIPFTSWAVEWVVGSVGYINVPPVVPTIARWVPAVLVGCALAWCGLSPIRRGVAWVLNCAFLWLMPALFTSVQYVLGTRALAGDVQEMLLMSRQILAATLGPDGGALPTILAALAIALAGVGARAIAARGNSQKAVG
ncbi:hypothetical protein [Paenarthrobacter sp. FR1]|uniref:hypothetical protein n=1 Tax=Paenarthrobacter sp. FR1 TaxID=3439548 RepID=UPI003DA5A5BB